MGTETPSYEELGRLLRAALERIALLEAENQRLREAIGLNSSNSSKPPSSDSPWIGKSQRERSGKTSGGQKGHKGRTLKMVAEPDRVVNHPAQQYCQCGANKGSGQIQEGIRRQVFDLPEIRIEVSEHRAEVWICQCGRKHQGEFPERVNAPAQYGPRVKAIVTYLVVGQLLPYGRTVETLEELMGIELSEGSLYGCLEQAHEGLAGVEEGIKQALIEAPTLHVDESSYRQDGEKAWWHVACTAQLTHYQASPHRGYEGFKGAGILPDYKGNLVHDFFRSYFQIPAQHNLCNAHLLRELQRVEEQYRQDWATQMRALLRQAKLEVEASEQQKLPETRIQEIHRQFSTLVQQGKALNPPLPQNKKRGKTKQSFAHNLLLRLQAHQNDILRFIQDPLVPFDNNQAERDLRMVKLKDKISGCARGKGATFFARIRGYLSTLRKQQIPPLAALEALFMGQPLFPRLC